MPEQMGTWATDAMHWRTWVSSLVPTSLIPL